MLVNTFPLVKDLSPAQRIIELVKCRELVLSGLEKLVFAIRETRRSWYLLRETLRLVLALVSTGKICFCGNRNLL